MKTIFTLIAISISGSALAASCPSIDKAIENYKAGTATRVDVDNALLCKMNDRCDMKLLLLKNKVSYAVDLFNVGEVSAQEIINASIELNKAELACIK